MPRRLRSRSCRHTGRGGLSCGGSKTEWNPSLVRGPGSPLRARHDAILVRIQIDEELRAPREAGQLAELAARQRAAAINVERLEADRRLRQNGTGYRDGE
jgi:hypothetical protein